jgi:hypothetical protein
MVSKKKAHVIFIALLAVFTIIGCEKEDEWTRIEYIKIENSIALQLDSIFSDDNNCLTMIEDKSQLRAVFSSGIFNDLDNCHENPKIDFNEYTLLVGKVHVYSISDKVASVNLSMHGNNYKVEVLIDKCTDCYGAIGYIYFWEVFPKLEAGYNYELIVN